MTDYHINVFWSPEDEAWVADIPDLRHCSAQGASPQEAVAEVLGAKNAWVDSAREHSDRVPESAALPRTVPAGDLRRGVRG